MAKRRKKPAKSAAASAGLTGQGAREELDKGGKALSVLEGILREREEILKAHEEKVIGFKSEYEKKLSALNVREEELNKRSELLKSKSHLEAQCKKLGNEELTLKASVARLAKDVERLQVEEARKKAEVARLQGKHSGLQKEFDIAYEKADKLASLLKSKGAEMRRVNHALADASARHEHVMSQITHHSSKEIKHCMRRAEDFLKKGLFEEALLEYERIRKFYSFLSKGDKKKVYGNVTRIRERLSRPFLGGI